MDKQKNEYWVYLGVINVKIHLDENNQICDLQIGNDLYQYRKNLLGKDTINRETLKTALKFLLVEEPEKFKNLYTLLKENDMEMFHIVDAVVNDVGRFCFLLTSEK